ncbi:MAG: glycosyltransferase family 4 protein [Patescibacteria group bacterium]
MEEVKSHPFLLATLEYPPQVGGVASFCAQVVKALPDNSLQVVTNQGHALLSKIIWPRWIKAVKTLYQLTLKTQAKGIIVAQVLPLGTAALVVRQFTHIPVHIMVHGLDVLGPQHTWRKKVLLKWVLSSAQSVIANSRYTANLVEQLGVSPKKVTILPLGPHIQPSLDMQIDYTWLGSLGIEPRDTVVLCAARLVRRKGIDQVIQVWPEVKKKFDKPLKLVIAGDGPDRTRLEHLASVSGQQTSIIFTGAVSDEQLKQLFARAYCFVLPTREEPGGDVEGFGIVFLEANAFGKPVVGGKSGGVPDAIVDGLNGYLVEPNSLPMLLKAILSLLEHPELAEKMGLQGKQRVLSQFNWETNVRLLAEQIGIPI